MKVRIRCGVFAAHWRPRCARGDADRDTLVRIVDEGVGSALQRHRVLARPTIATRVAMVGLAALATLVGSSSARHVRQPDEAASTRWHPAAELQRALAHPPKF